MKLRSQVAQAFALFLLSLVLLSCSPLTAEPEKPAAEAAKPPIQNATPPSLPVQYQKPSYLVDPASKDALDNKTDDAVLKVGAKISSTKKVALREIMKPLASQKKLNISWASDVNQDALVDVDIQANDDFYKAIENLLRQVDYFYEMQGSTLVIKYRETKQFHIAMPFKKQQFSTSTGGNVLGGGGEDVAKNIEGTLKLSSEKNEFDIWKNIESHMDSILKIERTVKISTLQEGATTSTPTNGKDEGKKEVAKEVTKEVTGGLENYYLIDKPVGLITVTAPRPILDKVEAYFTSLRKEIYKQVSIEAKIIEVQLTDDSAVGINWTNVLKNFDINGAVQFGAQTLGGGVTQVGQVFPYVFSNDTDGKWNNGTNHGSVYDPTRLVSNVRINTSNFDVFLNALKTEGNTKILSNPKISVLNGQPSMISVGRNVTYVKKITSTVTAGTGGAASTVNFTAEPGSILSGVGLGLTATILDNNEIIMDLVPVTSELEEGSEKAVIVAGEGATAISMGLPNVNIREMSTTVRVKDGEMLVIGGLISDISSTDGNFAPVIGDIPLIKYLFGHEEKVKHKRELIILLKPHII
ncbi:MAG: pilus (MSHA type) biogenesis protein MshL [Deltaproteobacteria bacterium]|nr:pilus (MSHA type) biogenesis protein MshL [Deltaproteobacteria bacterium]